MSLIGVRPKFIGLTATLREGDVEDVMHRLSLDTIGLFRKSCHMGNLEWEFKITNTENAAVAQATALATVAAGFGVGPKVIVITTSMSLCAAVGSEIQRIFAG